MCPASSENLKVQLGMAKMLAQSKLPPNSRSSEASALLCLQRFSYTALDPEILDVAGLDSLGRCERSRDGKAQVIVTCSALNVSNIHSLIYNTIYDFSTIFNKYNVSRVS